MPSSKSYDPEATVIKTKPVVGEVDKPASSPDDEFNEIIAKDVTKLTKGVLKNLEGFRTFILRGNVVDLAIGIVIGAAFTAVVNSVVGNIITPLIPIPGHSLAGLTWHPPYAGVDAKGNPVVVDFGALINAVISFLIVASVLYFFVVQPVNALMKLYHGKETEKASNRECPYCFQAVNVKATRCPYCTSLLPLDKAEKKEESEPVLLLPESLEKLSDKLAESILKKATTALEKDALAGAAGETTEGKE